MRKLIDAIAAHLIDDIHRAHTFLVTWLALGLGVVAEAAEYLPFLRDYFDPTTLKWIALAIFVARIIKQGKPAEAKNAG
ncbi:hypothetical protein M0D69_14075 [Caballeronia sp. SEWSISQ10-4 2]|uniref:DUF7940 domain-containing protein n=1 Tax=Caballeronia sp. SEWSISQ10-4 2 TaxID=2937438 RepID=UPI00264B8C72|nr:hypothetical protein [Caballeronia sp. SEWSISQ10-4 2]MDN7179122.1 hypothetical protein [Caballeronia sp. SEWSISQ10-4 2]